MPSMGSSRDGDLRSMTPQGEAGTPSTRSRAAGLPPGVITPFDLACASYLYEAMTDYARSLDKLRRCIGLENALDPSLEEHRLALLQFLNDWGCRGLATKWHRLPLAELERWYGAARDRLASLGGLSWPADARSRRDLAEVFDELSTSIAAHKMRKGRELHVSYGPTATAKTLFILRPDVFPAWDGPIRSALGYRGDGASYAQFTADVHAKIAESAEHYGEGRRLLENLPEALGRPAYTTLTQLVADYYWITITRGVKLREREEISRWLSW